MVTAYHGERSPRPTPVGTLPGAQARKVRFNVYTRQTGGFFVFVLVAATLAGGLTGCSGEATDVGMQRQRVIRDADRDDVLVQGARLLQREFGSVRIDTANRRADTPWVEFTTQDQSGTARDLYRGKSLMRHRAMLIINERGGQPVAQLRVDVQRQDTARQAAFRPRPTPFGDAPGQTSALDDDAATSYEQNTVWTTVRRNATLENQILDELREYFLRRTAGSNAETEVTPETEAP